MVLSVLRPHLVSWYAVCKYLKNTAFYALLADHTLVTVELLSRLLFVCRRQSVVRHGCIVAKRCKKGPRLLLIIDRKSHIGFEMT